ncbi:hypothetical protein [Teredinibacter sp. KSP-S5-2]|uniref:hypothetical protein n=1 Tax=Teredinibacter sp. KSP-S5-2 TaxID=3034506 RepID=UPI00293512C2|nr:hypothetical protein [Teredinibacter sp. KSP-S5-2]WNO09391.1 hypothetical protein P5V12_20835 [Teredinibacter sp. KSP-S5-2]
MKEIFLVSGFMLLSCVSFAGRLPTQFYSVSSLGYGFIRLNTSSVAEENEREYHAIRAGDIVRLTSPESEDACYMYYSSGAEQLKLKITNQLCQGVMQEIKKSLNGDG